MNDCIADTTLVNYGEGALSTNIDSEIIDAYSDSSQNVETIHRADELGNIYTDNSEFASSQPDILTDVTDNYDYGNEYSFDNTNILEESQVNIEDKFELPSTDATNITASANEYQLGEPADSNYESLMTEEMLMNEREREKKSKKELEEEEREKMQ